MRDESFPSYVRIYPSTLHGEIPLPPSKSHTMRALYFAALASGRSQLYNLLKSPDSAAMISALRLLGAKITTFVQEKQPPCSFNAYVDGIDGHIRDLDPTVVPLVDAGNSGQVLRFIAPLLAFQKTAVKMTGDASVQTLRPMKPLLDALHTLGASITYEGRAGFAPFNLYGPLSLRNEIDVEGADSQPVSALLMALPFLSSEKGIRQMIVRVKNMGERPWVNFTLWWLKRAGLQFTLLSETDIALPLGQKIEAFTFTVPVDASSLAFPLGMALMTHSSVLFRHVDLNDPQGDNKIVSLLASLGAKISYDPTQFQLRVDGPQTLHNAFEIDMDSLIDALPILSAIASASPERGELKLINAASARNKESDRIEATKRLLTMFGVEVCSFSDGLSIADPCCPDHRQKPLPCNESIIPSYNDHRMAMAAIVLAASFPLQQTDGIVIGPVECIQKSFPSFFTVLGQAGLVWREERGARNSQGGAA